MDRIPPSHQRTSCRGTYMLGVVVIEDNSSMAKLVQIWCRDLPRSMEADIIPTLE
jgi:hypothetical protein